MANNKQQKKTEVKKPNPDEIESSGGVVATSSSSSSTQAVTSDVYEFVSTPKHSSCSSGDENPIKSFDKCSDHEKSETDSDTLMTAANASLNLQQQKRTLGDQQDRSEDNLSPADDDSKRKKRKDSEFAPSSSTTSTNSTVCKEGKSSGTNRVTSRVGQKPPGPASKTMGLIGKSNDKSPCESPKLSKSPAETSEADNDDATKSSTDSNPKVPPLKIVIPQQTQQTQQLQTTPSQNQINSNEAQDQQTTNNLKTANKTPRNISSSSSTLPYVLNASSNSNDSISNDKTETSVLNAAGRSQSPTESNKSNNEDGKQTTGSKSKEPRVLRSSQRSGKDSKDDRSSNNSSPQLPVSSTPSPAAQNSGDSSSAGTESEVTSTAVITSQNIPNQMTSSSNSSSLLNQQQTQNQQQQAASSSSLHTSVDLHPRKRKIKVSSSCKEPTPSSSSSSSTSLTVTSSSTIDTKDSNSKDGSEKAQGSDHPHDQPYSNCYQMYIDLRKQIDQRHKNLHPIEPRPLKGLEDYLMNRRTYSLQGKTPMELNIIIPPLLPNQMKDTFCEQEKERHKLKMRHIVEKEKLVLSKEQEILRVHCKAAQMIANQAVPFSCCTILKDEEIYNIITPEQEEKYRNKNRERSHGRVFYQALKELDDKWDRIKVKNSIYWQDCLIKIDIICRKQ